MQLVLTTVCEPTMLFMITSPNLGNVLDKLKRARAVMPAKIKEALDVDGRTAIDVASPAQALKEIALHTMEGFIESEEERDSLTMLVGGFSAGSEASGMTFSFRLMPKDNLPTVFDINEQKWQEIVDWVTNFKDLIGDEKNQDPQVIASRVIYWVKKDPDPWLRTDLPGRGALNPTGLVAITGLTGIPVPRLSLMLNAVLVAWVLYMKERMPMAVRSKMREAFT